MILDLIPRGEKNKISTPELMKAAGYRSDRTLKAAIRRERLGGAMILSTRKNGGGYYRPASREEIAEYVRTFESDAASTFAVLRTARQLLNDIPGQIELQTEE